MIKDAESNFAIRDKQVEADLETMPKLRVLATIISYNRADMLPNAIEACLAQEGASCDVMVIDNASTDGTLDMVRERFLGRDVELCDLPCNVGCSGGYT